MRYEHVIKNERTGEYKVLGVNCVEHYFDNLDKVKVKKLKSVVKRYKNCKKDFEEAVKNMNKYYGNFNNYLDNCFYIYALKNFKTNFQESLLSKADSILAANLPLPGNIRRIVCNIIDKKFDYPDLIELNQVNKTKEKINKLIKTKGLNKDDEKYVLDVFYNIYFDYAYYCGGMNYINYLYFSFYEHDQLYIEG